MRRPIHSFHHNRRYFLKYSSFCTAVKLPVKPQFILQSRLTVGISKLVTTRLSYRWIVLNLGNMGESPTGSYFVRSLTSEFQTKARCEGPFFPVVSYWISASIFQQEILGLSYIC